MNLELEGKAALVTGGARGIGAAIALGLAREGCDVAVLDREPCAAGTKRAIESLGRRAIALEADVRDHAGAEAAIAAVIREWGRLDILVCNAGITADAAIWNMSEEQWDRVIEVNLKGYFNYNQAAARWFRAHTGGKIVNIASINALRGKFGQANYAASKAGVVALSKTLARELGRFNVNVNVVAPGMVRTAMTEALPEDVVKSALEESVLRRIATPEECADVVVFLCSDRARHVTGEIVQVDGGQYL